MTRLLLVEDDKSLGTTLKERLEKEGYIVDWATRYDQALYFIAHRSYSLVVLDVGLSDGSGYDLARKIRERLNTPFIFVTAQTSAEDRLKGYEIGAEEFIPKPFHLRELLLRVKHVLENHAFRRVTTVGSIKMDWAALTIVVGDRREKLTLRETQVLKYLVEQAPNAVSRDELLNRIWGEDEFPTNRTVDNVIVRLRQALGPEADRIVSVRGVGYQWTEEA